MDSVDGFSPALCVVKQIITFRLKKSTSLQLWLQVSLLDQINTKVFQIRESTTWKAIYYTRVNQDRETVIEGSKILKLVKNFIVNLNASPYLVTGNFT